MPGGVRSKTGLGIMLHKASYSYNFACNASPRRWRERFGQWLREAADMLDGRRTLAIEIDSDPRLPMAVQTDVMLKGLEHMRRCLKDAASDECREQLLRKAIPSVFDA